MTYDERLFWSTFPTWAIALTAVGLFAAVFLGRITPRKMWGSAMVGFSIACVSAVAAAFEPALWAAVWPHVQGSVTGADDVLRYRQMVTAIETALAIICYAQVWILTARGLPQGVSLLMRLARMGYSKVYTLYTLKGR